MEDNRKRYLVTKVESSKKMLRKEIGTVALCSLIAGAGAIGAVFLGQEVINEFFNGEKLTLQSKFLFDLKAGGTAWSLLISGLSTYKIVGSIQKIIDNVKTIKYTKNQINELENTEGRSL